MICNRRDLDAAINWLTRESHSPSKPAARDVKRCTYRGWPIYETDEVPWCYGAFVLVLLPSHENAILIAPWVVAGLAAKAEREGKAG